MNAKNKILGPANHMEVKFIFLCMYITPDEYTVSPTRIPTPAVITEKRKHTLFFKNIY